MCNKARASGFDQMSRGSRLQERERERGVAYGECEIRSRARAGCNGGLYGFSDFQGVTRDLRLNLL